MRTDILLDENKDLTIFNGDFLIGESDEQNVELHIVTPKGHYKQSPKVGVGIVRNTKSVLAYELKGEIRTELGDDGYNVNMLYQDTEGKIQLDFS